MRSLGVKLVGASLSLVVPGLIVLGLLVAGRKLFLTVVSRRQTGLRLWTCVLVFTLWLVLTVSIILPSSNRPLPIGRQLELLGKGRNTSVSQSFPSESEARVYLLAAGFEEEDIRLCA